MTTLAASTKKLERWTGRLNDKSSDVREEALCIVGQIAQAEPSLATASLNVLASFISENKFGKIWSDELHALRAIREMPPQLVLKSSQLLGALLKASLKHELNASAVAEILFALVESDELPRVGSYLQEIIQRSKSAMLLAHQGGRRDFMKVVDWAEDNGIQMAGSTASKAAEVKPAITRLDSRPGNNRKPAATVQARALPPQGESSAPFALDHDHIREKQIESETVSGYLAQIFEPDDAENAQALIAANASIVARVALRGIEPILFAFALRLASRTTWKRADAEALAASLGLMVDGALEHLNEAALEEWNVLFAEGADPIELSVEAVAGLAKQAQAAPPS